MSVALPLEKRHELGQFLSPAPVADFMASLFERCPREVRLLDAGAGAGMLSATLVKRWCEAERKPDRITVTAYELDEAIIPALEQTYAACESACLAAGIVFKAHVHHTDFAEAVLPLLRGDLFTAPQIPFDAAILNPPYVRSRVIRLPACCSVPPGSKRATSTRGSSPWRRCCSPMVAITPRSFCNGPYVKSFRQHFLARMSLRRLHPLDSRSAAFRSDDVLQENLIVHAVKFAVKPERVTVSSSRGLPESDIALRTRAYQEIVSPDDPGQFIHLVTDDGQENARQSVRQFSASLGSLGLEVSTGRVVDFRAREFLLPESDAPSFPLIYPCHFRRGFVEWPLTPSRKPNAIRDTEQTQELLVPAGIYVLVKRFTSKEERRRVVACVYDSRRVASEKVGFENHLNYFHARGKFLPLLLAKGLAVYLNSSIIDSYFRQFNGHTQVNATDLRSLPYPSLGQLEALGGQIGEAFPEQQALDQLLAAMRGLRGCGHGSGQWLAQPARDHPRLHPNQLKDLEQKPLRKLIPTSNVIDYFV